MSCVFMEPSFSPGNLILIMNQKQNYGERSILNKTGFDYGFIGMFTVLLEASFLIVESRVSETSSKS